MRPVVRHGNLRSRVRSPVKLRSASLSTSNLHECSRKQISFALRLSDWARASGLASSLSSLQTRFQSLEMLRASWTRMEARSVPNRRDGTLTVWSPSGSGLLCMIRVWDEVEWATAQPRTPWWKRILITIFVLHVRGRTPRLIQTACAPCKTRLQ